MSDRSQLQIYQEAEFRLCRKDPVYFLSNYWKIQTIGVGYGKFTLRDYQVEDVSSMWAAVRGEEKDRQVRLKARQIGWTTLATGLAFWDAFFHNDHPWLITSQGQSEAADTLTTKVKVPYSHLPRWMRERGPKLIRETSEEFEFDNNSRIIAIPSTAGSGRSKAVFGVLMDEAAFQDTADEVFAALDPLCYGPMFVFSTANGMGNFFHEIWNESQLEDSEWSGVFRPWSVVPERDEEWYRRTKRKYRTKEHLFYQEYPSTPEEAFSKSGKTALDMGKIRDMVFSPPALRIDLARIDTSSPFIESEVSAAIVEGDDERDIELHVWQEPYLERWDDGRLARQPNFAVAVDVAEGLDDGDYSTIVVYDVNGSEVVATLKAHIDIEELGRYVAWVGYWYYTALVGVERNNFGLVPLSYLTQIGYPRLYRMDTIAQIKRGDRTARYGFHTNKATKPKMVIDFNKALRAESLLIHDARFLQEAATFLSDGKGGFGASSGNNDDLVMAFLIGNQLMLDIGQYPVLWRDSTPGPITMGDVIRLGLQRAESEDRGGLASPIGQGRFREGLVISFEAPRPR